MAESLRRLRVDDTGVHGRCVGPRTMQNRQLTGVLRVARSRRRGIPNLTRHLDVASLPLSCAIGVNDGLMKIGRPEMKAPRR
jgi:hypothetical protein